MNRVRSASASLDAGAETDAGLTLGSTREDDLADRVVRHRLRPCFFPSPAPGARRPRSPRRRLIQGADEHGIGEFRLEEIGRNGSRETPALGDIRRQVVGWLSSSVLARNVCISSGDFLVLDHQAEAWIGLARLEAIAEIMLSIAASRVAGRLQRAQEVSCVARCPTVVTGVSVDGNHDGLRMRRPEQRRRAAGSDDEAACARPRRHGICGDAGLQDAALASTIETS